MPDLATVFRQALGVVGPRRLLFGSDSSFFPRGWHRGIFDQQCEALAAANVQGEEAAMILGGNLLRLVG
jgi:predicted TIM-barrel fold metal-dependent hydrolase